MTDYRKFQKELAAFFKKAEQEAANKGLTLNQYLRPSIHQKRFWRRALKSKRLFIKIVR